MQNSGSELLVTTNEDDQFGNLLLRIMGKPGHRPIAPEENWFPPVRTLSDEKAAHALFDKIKLKKRLLPAEAVELSHGARKSLHEHVYKRSPVVVNKILHYALEAQKGLTRWEFVQELFTNEENADLTSQALTICAKVSTGGYQESALFKEIFNKILSVYPLNLLNKGHLEHIEERQQQLAANYRGLINAVSASPGKDQEALGQLDQLAKDIGNCPLLNKQLTSWLGSSPLKPSLALLEYLQQRRYAFRHPESDAYVAMAEPSAPPLLLEEEDAMVRAPEPERPAMPLSLPLGTGHLLPGSPALAKELLDSKETPSAEIEGSHEVPLFCVVEEDAWRKLWDRLIRGQGVKAHQLPAVTTENEKAAESFFQFVQKKFPEDPFRNHDQSGKIDSTILHYASNMVTASDKTPRSFIQSLVNQASNLDMSTALLHSRSSAATHYAILEACLPKRFSQPKDDLPGKRMQLFYRYRQKINMVDLLSVTASAQLDALKQLITSIPLLQVEDLQEKLLQLIKRRMFEIPRNLADSKSNAETPHDGGDATVVQRFSKKFASLLVMINRDYLDVHSNWFPTVDESNVDEAIAFWALLPPEVKRSSYTLNKDVYGTNVMGGEILPKINALLHYAGAAPCKFLRTLVEEDRASANAALIECAAVSGFLYERDVPNTLAKFSKIIANILHVYFDASILPKLHNVQAIILYQDNWYRSRIAAIRPADRFAIQKLQEIRASITTLLPLFNYKPASWWGKDRKASHDLGGIARELFDRITEKEKTFSASVVMMTPPGGPSLSASSCSSSVAMGSFGQVSDADRAYAPGGDVEAEFTSVPEAAAEEPRSFLAKQGFFAQPAEDLPDKTAVTVAQVQNAEQIMQHEIALARLKCVKSLVKIYYGEGSREEDSQQRDLGKKYEGRMLSEQDSEELLALAKKLKETQALGLPVTSSCQGT